MSQPACPWGNAETCFAMLSAVAMDDEPEGDLLFWAEMAGIAPSADPREVVRALTTWCASHDIDRTLAAWRQAVEGDRPIAALGIASALPHLCAYLPKPGFRHPFGGNQQAVLELFGRALDMADDDAIDCLGMSIMAADMAVPDAGGFLTALIRNNRAVLEKASSGTKGMLPLYR